MNTTDYLDQALTRIAVEIRNRQATVDELDSKAYYLKGEINGLREAQHRIEQVREKVPKPIDPNTGEPV